MTTPSQVLDAALALRPEQRADISHKLLLSLEPADFDEDTDEVWATEIRRRLQAIREGRIVLRDWDEALARIRQGFDSRAKACCFASIPRRKRKPRKPHSGTKTKGEIKVNSYREGKSLSSASKSP
jgi:5S rRNA maturation endonuclease (ribonuclease M5)